MVIVNFTEQRWSTGRRPERDIKDLSAADMYERRQAQAVPHWEQFLAWVRQRQTEGMAHADTRDALSYLINHAEALQRYCDDGRLPISNIQSEHVAKTIAIARMNFLFADTTTGARASGGILSLIETARANGHHPQRYLSVVLTELPNVTDVAQVEDLLPWNLKTDQVTERYAAFPAPWHTTQAPAEIKPVRIERLPLGRSWAT